MGAYDERAAAPRLTKDARTRTRKPMGKQVILAHHVDGTGVVARRRERDVGGHVHVRGHSVSQGTVWPAPAWQTRTCTWLAYSSANVSRPSSTLRAAS